jgi:ribose transport system substrate-binding protein
VKLSLLPRRRAVIKFATAFAATAVLLSVAACGASGGSAAGGASVVSASTLASLRAEVAQAEQVPAFTPPGPAFDASKARGKTTVAVPSSSLIPYCAQTIQDMITIGKSIGAPVVNYPSSSGQTSWAQAAELALTSHAGAFTTICGINPADIAPQVAALRAKNVPVVALLGDVSQAAPPTVSAGTSIQLDKAVQLLADDAVVSNDGKPFHALVLTDYDIYAAQSPVSAAVAELKKVCGSNCPATVSSIPETEWTTNIESTVSGLLLKDPKITAVIALYDGMVPGLYPAVEGAHRANLKVYAYGASQGVVDMIPSTHGVVAADIGASASWTAYTQMDQVLRLLAGQQALPTGAEYPALRLWAPSNVAQFSGQDPYGTSYVSGFLKLWHVSG